MPRIKSLSARKVAGSGGNLTIEVTLATLSGAGSASVPSGASVGGHEAKAVEAEAAVAAVNGEIATALIGKEFDQQSLDALLIKLDGTEDKSRLGANAILGVSIAFARTAAAEQKKELYQYIGTLAGVATFTVPQPMFNVLNGGKHARGGIDVQECMLVPTGFKSTRERVEAAVQCVSALKTLLEQKGYGTAMGDEGGFAPALASNDEALDLLVSAIAQAGYTGKIKLALDIAASSLDHFDKEKMSAWYKVIAKKYPLLSIEDPFAEDDFGGFAALHQALGEHMLIVGDDLTVTNTGRIARAACDASL